MIVYVWSTFLLCLVRDVSDDEVDIYVYPSWS